MSWCSLARPRPLITSSTLGSDPDLRLHVTDSNPYCPGLYMAGVTPHWLPRARDTQRYRAALDNLLEKHAIDVLIPTSDYDVEGVVHYLRDGWTPKAYLVSSAVRFL